MRKLLPALQLVIIVLFIAVSQFYKLSSLPILIWDEARLGTSAYEMSKSGNMIVPTVSGDPDMWSTKPPMMIWAQAACIKVFGLSEFSIRFPSALCAAMFTLLAAYIVYSVTKNGWAAVLAAIVLSTCMGLLAQHGSRHGEYDAMLALFVLAYIVCFFFYTEANAPKVQSRYLILFSLFLSCAVLTKGVAPLIFTPALALYALGRNKVLSTLRSPAFYIGALLFMVIVAGYYLIREYYNPGYLQAVKDNELGGRFNAVVEGHEGHWSYYWELLRKNYFGVWYWVLPVSFIAAFLVSKTEVKRALMYFLMCVLFYVAVLSSSATKIDWYLIPAYPILAVLAGLVLHVLAQHTRVFLPSISRQAISVFFVAVFSIQPTIELKNRMEYIDYMDLERNNSYAISFYLRDVIAGKRQMPNFTYIACEYDLQWQIYMRALEEKGYRIKSQFLYFDNTVKIGDNVLINRPMAEQYIKDNFLYEIRDEFYGTKLLYITGIIDSIK